MSIPRSLLSFRPVLLAFAAVVLVVGAIVALTATGSPASAVTPSKPAAPTTPGAPTIPTTPTTPITPGTPTTPDAATTPAITPASTRPDVNLAEARPDTAARDASTTEQSTTWAGYVATGTRFRFVKATFRIPLLNCRKTPGTAKSPAMFADWVGLDGFGGSHVTVEQDGVYGQCERGVPSYGAWWETFPKPPDYPGMIVHAGDVIETSVYYSKHAREYQLILTDATDGEGFDVWRGCGSSQCQDATAEVITEQPATGTTSSKHYPFADFGTTNFSRVSITDAAGQRGGYGSSHWQDLRVFMVDSGRHMMASTSGVSSGGSAFWTRWNRES